VLKKICFVMLIPIFLFSIGNTDINILLQKLKSSSGDTRRVYMNRLKIELRKLNKASRVKEMSKIKSVLEKRNQKYSGLKRGNNRKNSSIQNHNLHFQRIKH